MVSSRTPSQLYTLIMNVVREINKINQLELDLGTKGSWHDDYKDSAYIYVGGLNNELTEGDVITIFSQYGEVMDVNLPRDKNTGKTKGFGFLMYEDQRSTILAVDNLNGAKVLERTLRVDHVKNYKQPKTKGEDGEWVEAEEQSMNARPELIHDDAASESSASSGPDIDPEDPMRDYLLAKYKEEKALKKASKTKSKKKHKDETPEERRARKERRKEKKLKKRKSEGMKAVEELLNELGARTQTSDRRSRSPSPRGRDRSPPRRDRHTEDSRSRYRSPEGRRNRSRSPPIAESRMKRKYRSPSPGRRGGQDRRASRYEERNGDRYSDPDLTPPSRRRNDHD
ncbi:hypothetical protein NLI96_g3342 [Meripilus lineatus]|uniref:RRM domain-containing protein n=1 Tax=Meripilus lineatus TaxID=2056292 RepID=A0AAD5V915_9APHY|nr:hypothetical protein NLI96_g3342 [Physisporinus lineatus]